MNFLLSSLIPDSMGQEAWRWLALDRSVLHKDDKETSARESLLLSASCLSVALSVTFSLTAGGVQVSWWKTRGHTAVGEAA